jgi:hypothetical protein
MMPMISASVLVGAILFAVGALLALWTRKRRFDRTNQFGVERFTSYWGKLRARSVDWVVGLAGIILLSAGALILAFEFESSWGWIVLLPVYLFVLFGLIGF